MTLAATPLVGSAHSRRFQGRHPGLEVVVVGDGPAGDVVQSLGELVPEVVRAVGLAQLAEVAAGSSRYPLIVADASLSLSTVALLDVVDGPSAATAVVTLEPTQLNSAQARECFAPVRVSDARRVESAATSFHRVTSPTAAGLGVLRVAAGDRERAAQLWREASPPDAAGPVDLALLALVRGGVPVAAQPLGLYTVERGPVRVDGPPGSAWQQRLRSSSRGNDGAFSKAVVRPVSRRLTAVGLRGDWSPNVVTVVSLLLGLLAAGLVLGDVWWAWVLAAAVLQLSLVVDCVDGEIARFTRSYSPLGAWLDGVSDRVKEFAVIGAVTAVGVRDGHDLWGLAILLLALLTVRQVEDQGYHSRLRASARAEPAPVAVLVAGDGGPAGASTTLTAAPAGRRRAAIVVRQVLHVPIAERYLILSVGLLTFRPVLVLVALTVAVLVAFAWTHVGRAARALAGRDGFAPERPDPELASLLDAGPLARLTARFVRWPVWAAWLGVALAVVAWALMRAGAPAPLAVLVLLLVVVLVGPGLTAAASTRLGWLLPGGVVGAEAMVVLGVTAGLPAPARWAGYTWFGAVAWHRYDVAYRIRETGQPPRPWLRALTLGAEGRMLLVTVGWAVGAPIEVLLGVGSAVLLVIWVGESGYSWRSLAAGHR